jgi:hypothetical protein
MWKPSNFAKEMTVVDCGCLMLEDFKIGATRQESKSLALSFIVPWRRTDCVEKRLTHVTYDDTRARVNLEAVGTCN